MLSFAISAVLAGTSQSDVSFPGPIIRGFKVPLNHCNISCRFLTSVVQGDQFALNVIDRLTDTSMLRSTSIVSAPSSYPGLIHLQFYNKCSTGTACSKKEALMLMALSVSLSAPSYLAILSITISEFLTKRGRSGTILITVSKAPFRSESSI